jgi:hypothetical protein
MHNKLAFWSPERREVMYDIGAILGVTWSIVLRGEKLAECERTCDSGENTIVSDSFITVAHFFTTTVREFESSLAGLFASSRALHPLSTTAVFHSINPD